MSFEKEQKGGIYLMDAVKEDKGNEIQTLMKNSQKKTGYPYTYELELKNTDTATATATNSATAAAADADTVSANTATATDDKNNVYINGMMTMILNAVEVKCMSYRSLKGFIFIIEVAEVVKSNANFGGGGGGPLT